MATTTARALGTAARATEVTTPPAPAHGRRPALDGIRALAVLSVAVYHFGGGATSWLPGGFLGVDVFFVLSGYLITTLLLDEHARRGRIDLAAFWVRRARRLMPALIVVLLAVCAWVWWATPPDAYPRRRADVFWTLGYLANWHFIRTAEDYFAAYASASPLRHAWSLAVEEQFYLLWPAIVGVLFWLGRRAFRRRGGRPLGGGPVIAAFAVVGIALSAVAMAVQYAPDQPSRAYYGTDGRVQELFVGVLLAVLLSRRGRLTGTIAGRWRPVLARRLAAVAAAGLVALVAALFLASDTEAPYYLGGALAVSLATAAVIAGVELRPAGRLAGWFSWAPAVALGRISYGVYLWHWPVVIAIPVQSAMPAGEQVAWQALRVAVTLTASVLSYVLVERPVLEGTWFRRSRRRVLLAAAAAIAAVAALAVPATALPGTLGDQLRESTDHTCPGEDDVTLLVCRNGPGDPAAPPALAMLGDSTARALGQGLDRWAAANGASWTQAAWQRCTATGLMVVPSNLIAEGPDRQAIACHDQATDRIREMLDADRPPVVLIAEFWVHHQPIQTAGGELVMPGTTEHDDILRAEYGRVADEVAAHGGRTVFVELPPPGESVGSVVATGRPAGTARSPVPGAEFVEGFNDVLRSVAATRPQTARAVSVTDVVCPDGSCTPVIGGTLVRTDGVHYSREFSARLVPVLLERSGVTP